MQPVDVGRTAERQTPVRQRRFQFEVVKPLRVCDVAFTLIAIMKWATIMLMPVAFAMTGVFTGRLGGIAMMVSVNMRTALM